MQLSILVNLVSQDSTEIICINAWIFVEMVKDLTQQDAMMGTKSTKMDVIQTVNLKWGILVQGDRQIRGTLVH